MSKNDPSLNVGKNDKLILYYPDPDLDQSQNLIDWTLAEGLSFHKIWFKSINNFWRYPANKHTHTQTDMGYHISSTTSLAEVIISVRT